MAAKILKTGGNAQKTVLTMLVAILVLEFGSFTKLRKVWALAFTGSDTSSQGTPTGTPTNNTGLVQLVQVQPTTHPTSTPTVTL